MESDRAVIILDPALHAYWTLHQALLSETTNSMVSFPLRGPDVASTRGALLQARSFAQAVILGLIQPGGRGILTA